MVYTLDILATTIGQTIYGGDHGNSVGGENQSESTPEPGNLFCELPRIDVHQMRGAHGE